MSVTINTSGSQVAVVGTEHTLATIITAGVYHLAVDLTNLQDGDTLELSLFATINSNSRRLWIATFSNNPDPAGTGVGIRVALSPPVPTPTQTVFTLNQSVGSAGRTFAWEIWQYS